MFVLCFEDLALAGFYQRTVDECCSIDSCGIEMMVSCKPVFGEGYNFAGLCQDIIMPRYNYAKI